jgi:hypothetical protein
VSAESRVLLNAYVHRSLHKDDHLSTRAANGIDHLVAGPRSPSW